MTLQSTKAHLKPKTAMILAAGLGKRMRPITSTMPKPLIEVRGKALIDYGLDALARNGVEKVVVNVHYLADLMRAHLRKRKDMKIVVSDETDALLDSGGGIVKALPDIGSDPFYLINADTFWIDGYRDNLDLLAELWQPERMDASLLIADMRQSYGYDGRGDFVMDPTGQLARVQEHNLSPFIYAGAAILKPELFAGRSAARFSLNAIFDTTIEADRLFGVRLDGVWITVGTPSAISMAEAAFLASAAA
ncbi:nucleotidyltransferase family protein [Jiella sp. MQZ9-1]|uniref:Nucleotidyltransferase family protein n=1 Tax=Jiella flava TaxID=2816857 RepID=A0A939G0A6_9HYPH|nr:nucleotidyltransferase family protein [Jiella flava]MBO0663238.1 nucleotidyltransferase family protein [Jiella flava]MCD2471814.1 nucleotidyltransferase family protein [Jiella flava]